MKIRAHKRLFRALGTIVSRKFGTGRLAIKLKGTLLKTKAID